MPRSGAWAALLALSLAYACGGGDRDFGNDTDTGGAAGKGGASSGGSAGKTNSGGTAGKTNSGGSAGKSTTGGSTTDAGAGGQMPPEGGAVGTGGSATGGTGGQGGEGGGGGEGGDGIVIPPDPGRPGTAVVAGGYFMKSAHYSLVCSTGEGPGGNTLHTSAKYRLIGGLIGTSQP